MISKHFWCPLETTKHQLTLKVPWSGAADGAGAAGAGGTGAVLAEDVVLPPQADSWMRAAVQQELLREQLQEQAVAQQFHHHQQYAAAGVGMPPVDMSQQPLLNAQVCVKGVVKGVVGEFLGSWVSARSYVKEQDQLLVCTSRDCVPIRPAWVWAAYRALARRDGTAYGESLCPPPTYTPFFIATAQDR